MKRGIVMDDKNKMTVNKENIIVGLDIGGSKIAVFIGLQENQNQVRVLGFGVKELKKNPISDLDFLISSIGSAVKEAETMTGFDVKEVYVGVAGDYISCFKSKGGVTLDPSKNEVKESHVAAVIKDASTLPSTAGEILHIFPRNYSLDDVQGIKNPIGMSGVRLDAEVQIVAAKTLNLQNHKKSVEKAGFEIKAMVLEPLAAAYAILHDEERELGVAIIDIGATSADLAVFYEDAVCYSVSLDLAGNIITSDIAKSFDLPISIARAEEIKKKYGTVAISNVLNAEVIPVPGIGDRGTVPCSRERLARVMHARLSEILGLIADHLRKRQLDKIIGAGIVLTGGTSATEGIVQLAEGIFKKPVRLGQPKQDVGLGDSLAKPSFSVGVGLLHYAAKTRKKSIKETSTQGILSYIIAGTRRFIQIIKRYI